MSDQSPESPETDPQEETYFRCPGLTVGALRKALEGVPDDLVIVVRAEDDYDETYVSFCGGILGAAVEHDHDEDDTPFFAIDCTSDESLFDEAEAAAADDDE